MESYYAHIVDNIVVSVEVVTEKYFNANPKRYSGTWKKVGTEEQPFVGKNAQYIPELTKIIETKPSSDCSLDKINGKWIYPKEKPGENYCWDENKKEWVTLEAKE